jgi:RsiW-degrading membrane proteinase PrsW (M82 family)
MADIREKSGPQALLLGFISFVAFEVVAYYLLRYLTSGLGESNQEQTDHTTIVSNWVKTMAFLVLHLALVIAAVLVLSNRLPRRHRGQLMGWFYSSLVTGFLLLIPLFND